MLITCIYNNQLFLLAKKTFKTRLVLPVAFREHKCLVPYITTGALRLHFFVTLGSEGFFTLAEKELGLQFIDHGNANMHFI